MVLDSGWERLVDLCCKDLLDYPVDQFDEIRVNSIFLQDFLIKRMCDCYNVYLQWGKSWPICQLQARINPDVRSNGVDIKASFNQHMSKYFTPTIKESIEALQHFKGDLRKTRAYMDEVTLYSQPSFIRMPDISPGYADFKEPPFEPLYNRNRELTDIVFTCITEVLDRGIDYKDISISDVIGRVFFYEQIYFVFSQEFWPQYILEELHAPSATNNTFNVIFSRLLKLELDTLQRQQQQPNDSLISLFGF